MFLIMQMPKTGTNTLIKTFTALSNPQDVYRIHYINSNFFDKILGDFNQIGVTVDYNIFFYFQQHLAERGNVIKRLFNATDPNVFITTAVREPISMLIASFFQLIDNLNEYARNDIWQNISVEDLIHVFKGFIGLHEDIKPGYSRLLNIRDTGGFPQEYDWTYYHKVRAISELFSEWFNDNLKWFFKYDVFESDYSPYTGYTIHQSGRYRILFYQFERCMKNMDAILTEFLSFDTVSLKNDNISKQKSYAPVYEKFKSVIKFPSLFLHTLYSSKLVRFSYSDPQISSFYRRWSE